MKRQLLTLLGLIFLTGGFVAEVGAETITIPVWRDVEGRPRVDVTFENDETYNFIIDTGMMKTMILPELVEALALSEAAPSGQGSAHGRVMPGAAYPSLPVTIGGKVGYSFEAPQVIANLKISEETVYGVLGSEFLQRYTVAFDPEGGRMILSDEGPGAIVKNKNFTRLPMYSPFANLWMMEAAVGPVPVTVFLDTGANGSLINPKVFEQLGSEGVVSEPREERNVLGVGGSAENFSVVVQSITAGIQQWQEPQVRVTPGIFSQLRLLDKPAMIMGSDLLLSGMLVMDYPNKQVFFEVKE